jgi:hypothetical protein
MISSLPQHAAATVALRLQEARRDAERAHRLQVERVRASLLMSPHAHGDEE